MQRFAVCFGLLVSLALSAPAQDRIYRCGGAYTNTVPPPNAKDCKLVESGNVTVGEAARFVEQCRSAISFTGPEAPNPTVALDVGFCFGLMDGVRGANFYLRKAKSEMAFCEPTEFRNDDLAKTFVATADKNPHLKELRGSLAALVALSSAFPCKKVK